MTFQDIVNEAGEWIGGHLETQEGEYEGYNTKIAGLSINKEIFKVHTTCGGEVSVNTNYSEVKVVNERFVKFNIPYVGIAYITKPIKREQPQRVFTL